MHWSELLHVGKECTPYLLFEVWHESSPFHEEHYVNQTADNNKILPLLYGSVTHMKSTVLRTE